MVAVEIPGRDWPIVVALGEGGVVVTGWVSAWLVRTRHSGRNPGKWAVTALVQMQRGSGGSLYEALVRVLVSTPDGGCPTTGYGRFELIIFDGLGIMYAGHSPYLVADGVTQVIR